MRATNAQCSKPRAGAVNAWPERGQERAAMVVPAVRVVVVRPGGGLEMHAVSPSAPSAPFSGTSAPFAPSVPYAPAQADVVIPMATPVQVTQHGGALEEIKKLKELLDMGAITQSEYDRKKTELLGR